MRMPEPNSVSLGCKTRGECPIRVVSSQREHQERKETLLAADRGRLGALSLLIRRIRPRRRLVRQARMGAAEIGCGRILADRHDALADGAGAGEMFEQRVAVAAPDGAG